MGARDQAGDCVTVCAAVIIISDVTKSLGFVSAGVFPGTKNSATHTLPGRALSGSTTLHVDGVKFRWTGKGPLSISIVLLLHVHVDTMYFYLFIFLINL